MKTVVLARCLNEERNVKFFIENYSWADNIVLCDGGSTDRTLEIASGYPKVVITTFEEKIDTNYKFFNPESKHLNKAINDALALNPDWVFYDDMDDAPNYLLFDNIHTYLKEASEQGKLEIFARRYYMWGYREYFPSISSDNPPDNSLHSIWGWRAGHSIRGTAEARYNSIEIGGFHPDIAVKYFIPVPNCLVHYSWPNEQMVREKMSRYASWGRPQLHPLESFGPAHPREYFLRVKYPYDDDKD